jgi:hypothetical protein
MGLKEPQVLIELALRLMQRQLDNELLVSTSRLLGRPFGDGERIIVKPGNEANNLAEPLLRADQRSKVILLYAPLPRFLGSVAQKGMWGRIWARRLYGVLQRQGGPEFGFTDAQAFELTDLQVAGLAWLQNHAQFMAIATAFPGRVRTLDSATFLARRVETMAAVGSHFDLQLDHSGWQKIAESEVFDTHSKEIGRSFDAEERAQVQSQGRTIDEEIEMVTKWARAVGEQIGLAVDMPAETALVAAV